MLEKQIWVYWHLHLQVVVSTIHAAFSGLFGLGTLTKGIFQCNNSKWSQRHQKIWKNDTIQPLAFDLAFTTFIGLLYFSRNPWCLRSPVVCKKTFSDHYFININFQMKFSKIDLCALLGIKWWSILVLEMENLFSISDHSGFSGYCAQARIEGSQGNNLPKISDK